MKIEFSWALWYLKRMRAQKNEKMFQTSPCNVSQSGISGPRELFAQGGISGSGVLDLGLRICVLRPSPKTPRHCGAGAEKSASGATIW